MFQLVADVPISGSFVDYLTLNEYFTIRDSVFLNFKLSNLFSIYTTLPI